MGFYYKGNYYSEIHVNNYIDYKEPIEIINNEKIIFYFNDFIQSSDDAYINTESKQPDNDNTVVTEFDADPLQLEKANIKVENCLYKISIDYDDGNKDVKVRPISNPNNNWLIFEHQFSFTNKEYFQGKQGLLVLKIYNLYGFVTVIEIPYILKVTTMAQQAIELDLIKTNLDNNKKISYIFEEVNKHQIFLARN